MEYVNFGKAGVKVSRLALGLAFRRQPDADIAERTVERAIEHGINFIDCANAYGLNNDGTTRGTSEEVLGRVLKRHRDDLFISSKVYAAIGDGPNDGGGSRYHIMREIDRTLTRLDTDHIDLYILHDFDPTTPVDETLRAMDDLVTTGKIRYIGLSNHRAWQVIRALWTQDKLGLDPLICVQEPYNLLNRDIEMEMIPAIHSHGFGLMTYSPLAVGLLSGAYVPGEAPPAGSLYATVRRDRYETEMDAAARDIIDALHEVAATHNKTIAQTAINWVLSHPEISAAITGGDTPEHMDDNIGAIGWSITDHERERLDELSFGQRRVLQ
ncbi:MAG: aldo/keto reductase [Chloroflexi bacterium]|jgi:1-deoxyxylulose-5-phosphate synthase|nr:aldo/keto reductase [Chloroflexota bacterium]MBT4072656.1 aldo/keto reductase [Chloroflexota bacterium]MBT6682328.1 aldo/keto reductase [Chloroflexota bacterium]